MIAFAEQIEIELGQHRRKAVGILQLDLAVAEAGAQPVVLGIVERPREQTGRVDALELALAVRRRRRPRGWHPGRKTRTTVWSFSVCGPR